MSAMNPTTTSMMTLSMKTTEPPSRRKAGKRLTDMDTG
jgi:hypothetical protein